jgi:hypothetical protein
MKITKKRLQEIVLEEMRTLKENPFATRRPAGQRAPEPEGLPADKEQEDPIQKRVTDIIDRMRRTLSTQMATVDDPNEVIPFVMAVFDLLRELNPDLTNSEMDRTITMLRTKVLPDAQRSIKQQGT